MTRLALGVGGVFVNLFEHFSTDNFVMLTWLASKLNYFLDFFFLLLQLLKLFVRIVV